MTAVTRIPFHGSNLIVRQGDSPETTMVAMKQVVEGMGLDWTYQSRKLSSHPVLKACVAITAMQMPGDDQEREHTFLPLNRLHFWLATIHPDRIKDFGVRENVIVYQTEVADTLFEKFFGRAIAAKGAASGKQVAAIVDDKIKSLEVRLKALVSDLSPSATNADYVSVHELLINAKAAQRGRRKLNGRIGWELRDRALTAGLPSPCRRCPHTGVWRFQRDFASAYMAERGLSLVADHNDSVSNQGILQFPRKFRRGGASS